MKFTTHGLQMAGLELVPPFQVDVSLDPDEDLTDQPTESLTFQTVARVLPGRRLSGVAEYQGKSVFAKLFYGPRARRYWERELQGANMMAQAGTSTPAVLEYGATADNAGFVVMYEAIANAQTLAEDNLAMLLQAVEKVAAMHEANIMQTDIHLNNFVLGDGNLYVVDADGVRRGALLRHHFRNLALLLAQRPPWFDDDIDQVWTSYVGVRGEYVAKMGSAQQIKELTLKARAGRVRTYLDKTQRECTEFVRRSKFTRDFVCDREHWQRLQRFMVIPEVYLGEGTPLKLGNSATVIRCQIDGESYVIKRYNIKSLGHRIRRWFNRRARNAWRNGHWLSFLGIETARPIALLEQRFGWFAGVSYVVMPDVGDRDLGQVLSSEPDAFQRVAEQAVGLITKLKAAGIEHTDMKATNFIEQEHNGSKQLVLIDVDAVRAGPIDSDVERFLKNWEGDEALYRAWTARLSEAGL